MKYKILRFPSGRTFCRGLSLSEAQAHCSLPSTSGKNWFHGYTWESCPITFSDGSVLVMRNGYVLKPTAAQRRAIIAGEFTLPEEAGQNVRDAIRV